MADDDHLTPLQRQQVEQVERMLNDPSLAAALANAGRLQLEAARWHVRALAALQRGWGKVCNALAQVDWPEAFRLINEYQQLMPSNLVGRTMLKLNLSGPPQSTVPLAWVVPGELATTLVYDCQTDDERIGLVLEHQDEILDQCETVLEGLLFPAADATRQAIESLRLGLEGPAQSHAGNVIDSVVLAVFAPARPSAARKKAVRRGKAELPNQDEVSVRALVDRVVLGPLVSAYEHWYPENGEAPPEAFARHVTAHAAHLDGVFTSSNSLMSVMLASSLVVHYRNDLAGVAASQEVDAASPWT